MYAIVFPILTVLAAADPGTTPENATFRELVEQGVAMPDGQVIALPAPTMAEGLDAAGQAEVLTKTATLSKATLQQFLDSNNYGAPVCLKQKNSPAKVGGDLIRYVNLHFVVFGDWDVLTSEQFSKTILKAGNGSKGGGGTVNVIKACYLKDIELAMPQRHSMSLKVRQTPTLKEYFLYTRFQLFGRVEISSTRFCEATKTPAGVIVAAKVDPRFAKDKEYPNESRVINKGPLGDLKLGPAQPYSGAGFYAKVTRLIAPANAIFIEFHEVFYEPQAWFSDNGNLMPAELRKIIPFKVKEFRQKLARATEEHQAEKTSADAKPAEK